MKNKIFISNNDMKGLIKTALPSVLSMVAFSISQIAGASFLRESGKIELLSVVSICYPLFMAVLSVGQGIGVGGCSLVAKFCGQKDSYSRKNALFSTLIIGVGISIFLTAILLLCRQNILALLSFRLKAKEAEIYYTVFVYGCIFTVMIMVLNNLSRGCGYVWHSFMSMFIYAAANVAGDYVAVYIIRGGAYQIALSLIISQMLGCVYLIAVLFAKKEIDFRISKPLFKKTAYTVSVIGSPVFLTQLGAGISMAVLIYFASYSKEVVSGFVIGNKVYMMVFQAILGFTQGLLPFCAYYFGKNKPQELKKALYSALKICCGTSLISTAVFLLFNKQILGVFAGSGEIYLAAKTSLVLRGITLPAAATVQVFTVYYQSTLQKIKAAALSLLRQLVFLLPLCYLVRGLPFGRLTNICLAIPIADVLTFSVCLMLAKNGIKNSGCLK